MEFIILPFGQELQSIEYFAKRFCNKYSIFLKSLTITSLFEYCSKLSYDPDTTVNQIVNPDIVLSGTVGVNCKDIVLIGIMWCTVNNAEYKIIEEEGHIFLQINFVDSVLNFDPIKELIG